MLAKPVETTGVEADEAADEEDEIEEAALDLTEVVAVEEAALLEGAAENDFTLLEETSEEVSELLEETAEDSVEEVAEEAEYSDEDATSLEDSLEDSTVEEEAALLEVSVLDTEVIGADDEAVEVAAELESVVYRTANAVSNLEEYHGKAVTSACKPAISISLKRVV